MKEILRYEYLAILVIFLIVGALALWPGTYWFDPKIKVDNFSTTQEPVVQYTRNIKRPFFGTYRVEVRDVEAEPHVHACTGNGLGIYEREESGTQLMPLSKYVNNKNCKNLPPADYVIHTCWKWYVFILPKNVCEKSNKFTIIG